MATEQTPQRGQPSAQQADDTWSEQRRGDAWQAAGAAERMRSGRLRMTLGHSLIRGGKQVADTPTPIVVAVDKP
jgi:hypothetical protein